MSRLSVLSFPIQIPLFIALPDCISLVEMAFALCDGDSKLDLAVLEIEHQGHYRQAFLVDLAVEFFDFMMMKQELSRPQRIMVAVMGEGIRADMHLINKDFAVFQLGIGVFQVGPALSERFDLAALQHDARFILVFKEKIVSGFPVFGYFFDVFIIQLLVSLYLQCCSIMLVLNMAESVIE